MSPHAMRHTHTSLLLQDEQPPAWVAAQARRSLAVTMRIYAHFLPRQTGAAVDRLASKLSGPNGQTRVTEKQGPSGYERARTAAKLRAVSRK